MFLVSMPFGTLTIQKYSASPSQISFPWVNMSEITSSLSVRSHCTSSTCCAVTAWRPGIARSVVLAKLLYASSAWWGFTTTDDRHRIEAVVRRGVRAGLYPADEPTAAQLVQDYDVTLFCRLMNSEQHVLHQLLPAQSDHHYNLRPRPHNLSLSYAMDHRNFIPRLAFKDTY